VWPRWWPRWRIPHPTHLTIECRHSIAATPIVSPSRGYHPVDATTLACGAVLTGPLRGEANSAHPAARAAARRMSRRAYQFVALPWRISIPLVRPPATAFNPLGRLWFRPRVSTQGGRALRDKGAPTAPAPRRLFPPPVAYVSGQTRPNLRMTWKDRDTTPPSRPSRAFAKSRPEPSCPSRAAPGPTPCGLKQTIWRFQGRFMIRPPELVRRRHSWMKITLTSHRRRFLKDSA
jgi:hypothetical protein